MTDISPHSSVFEKVRGLLRNCKPKTENCNRKTPAIELVCK